MNRYEVIESRVWQRDDGQKASIYGACPWTSTAERARWQIVNRGWTLRDNRTNTVGLGRVPFARQDEAQALADKLNKPRVEECLAPELEPFCNGPDTTF